MARQEHAVREGARFRVAVEGWASDGSGVARVDGMAVFVKGGIPGEVCVIEIEHVGHRAAWAHVAELSCPSSRRQTPDCPHSAACGGCQLRNMEYEAELAFKRQRVRDALTRIGGLDIPVPPVLPAREISGYRNKAVFPVAPGPRVGFFQERSHQVTDVSDCALQTPAANSLAAALRQWMKDFSVPAYNETDGSGLVRHLFVRSNAAGDCVAAVVVNGAALPAEDTLVDALRAAAPSLVGVVLNQNTRRTNVVLGDQSRTLWGTAVLVDRLRGRDFQISLPAFYQVNHPQTEILYALVESFAAFTGEERLLDLYCGTGTIGLSMAHRCKSLLGVEVVPSAVADAEENARRNGIRNAEFLCGDAGKAAKRLAARGERADVAVVDPPRKGLSPDVVDSLLQIAPRRLIYVSCDPATLARDLKLLRGVYRVQAVQPLDLFPRTSHIETVCALSRIK